MQNFLYIENITPLVPSFKSLTLRGLQPIFDC